VPPCDVEALASAINRLLNDAELRDRYGKAARERATRDFTSEAMARRTLELYDRVLARPKLV
jgi:glycosyltransferase involved in cell wall biosynthesis